MSVMHGQRALELAVGDQRWSLQGGRSEEHVLTLRIAVLNGSDFTKYEVRLPLDVVGDELEVGGAQISEGWVE